MHELALIQNLLEGVLGQIEANNYQSEAIKGLAVTIGALELHSEQAFRQAYAIESKGTELEGKPLELTIVPAQVECSKCGFHGPLPEDKADPHNCDLIVECPQCSVANPIKGGRGIQKIELILDS
jgi:Zn finger protein HypA/HybF involved in hydrogenase expression